MDIDLKSVSLYVLALVLWIGVRNYYRRIPIRNPTFGMLNLLGAEGRELLEEDRENLTDVVGTIAVAVDKAPKCTVLFLYGRLNDSGCFEGTAKPARNWIRESGCRMAIFASDNSRASYDRAIGRGMEGVTIQMTTSRRGAVFSQFFRRLFRGMRDGGTMREEFQRFAPQESKTGHYDCPDTFGFARSGPLRFRWSADRPVEG